MGLLLLLPAALLAAQPAPPPEDEYRGIAPPPPSFGIAPRRGLANLATYFRSDDYPAEALANHEEGIVTFRIEVGADGRAAGCAILVSSGSPTLDSTTCGILIERTRFIPARDSAGQATSDQVFGRIRWILPIEPEPEDASGEDPPLPQD